MKFVVDTAVRIEKPVQQVFQAVVDPQHLNKYFVTKSSAPLKLGETVLWEFSSLEKPLPVTVTEFVLNQKIQFKWEASGVSYQTVVDITFEDLKEKGTMMRIKEQGWETDQVGYNSSQDHGQGWMHMVCCLKSYLVYGIDLRNQGQSCEKL
jgi:uncharacterized protein YndB with AHSA1/START domain